MVVWLGEMVAISHVDGTKEGREYKKQSINEIEKRADFTLQMLHFNEVGSILLPTRIEEGVGRKNTHVLLIWTMLPSLH